jgi:hypothetical protein
MAEKGTKDKNCLLCVHAVPLEQAPIGAPVKMCTYNPPALMLGPGPNGQPMQIEAYPKVYPHQYMCSHYVKRAVVISAPSDKMFPEAK